MADFRFSIPIQVRYGDLDPQWHVNNSRFLTYMEQARFEYLRHVKLWESENFFEIGLIVADVHVAYLAPIELGERVRSSTRVTHIGSKSLKFEYQLDDEDTGKVLATGETVMVAYDYNLRASKPVPEDWRRKISEFEGVDFTSQKPG